MNNTNRPANRLLILVCGLLLLTLGSVALALVWVTTFTHDWRSTGPEVITNVHGWFSASVITGTSISWWWVAVLAFLLLVVITLVVFIFRQGHGHTSGFVRSTPDEHGTTVIDSRVAEQLVHESLAGHRGLVAAHVSTYLVRKTPVLKISAIARRGVSPKAIIDSIEENLSSLDTILGQHVLASIQVGGGFRAKTSSSTRLE